MDGYYPIFLRVGGNKAVVLGGGPVAARKAAGLVKAGARVTVVSPALCPELASMVSEGRLSHTARGYEPSDLDGSAVVIAATDDPDVNETACSRAATLGIPANSVRPPSAGSFIVPSTVHRGGLALAISTGGACPALAKRLRRDLEERLGAEYGPFLDFLEEARTVLKQRIADESARADALSALVESGLVDRFRNDGPEAGRAEGRRLLEGFVTSRKR